MPESTPANDNPPKLISSEADNPVKSLLLARVLDRIGREDNDPNARFAARRLLNQAARQKNGAAEK